MGYSSISQNFFCHYQIVGEPETRGSYSGAVFDSWGFTGSFTLWIGGRCGLAMVRIAWRQCCSCRCLWDYSSPDLGLVISHYRFPIKQGDPL